MPIYEYVCQSCEHRFEVKQRFSDAPLSSCERCGQAIKKIISAPAIMFKGSGWYVTDYSDKLKAPGQSEPAPKPDNEDQKTPANTSSDSTASTPNGGAATESSSSSKPSASPSSSSTPSSAPSSSSTPSSGKTTD